MERGFAAIASDIAEIKSTMATNEGIARLDHRFDNVEARLGPSNGKLLQYIATSMILERSMKTYPGFGRRSITRWSASR